MKNNPYVGPRPYERDDRENFYGRQREARDLTSLIMAERVVLFYAPSGAGKTSLLNTQIIPALEEKGFNVLPAVRVGSDLSPDVAPGDVNNVFVFNALIGLAENPHDFPKPLASYTLLSFLRHLHLEEDESDFGYRPPILIFDQLEELFTTHRERWEEARGFFEQMREALQEMPTLGVLLTMREDHVAELDPYAPLLPRRLQARFRMERLDRKGALEAVQKPAQNAGCPFDPGVAERLVDDLRRIRRVSASASQREDNRVLGPYVEPVQLQVVCSRLWENLPEQEDARIQWEEIEAFGDVDRALIDFYEDALARCVRETHVSERRLRRWFAERLITPMETRGLALRGGAETAGLPNEAVDILEEQHLIRADRRAGGRWYELCHDRLVEPILAANRAWQAKRQDPLSLAAGAWLASDKDPEKLFKGAQLEEARARAEANPNELTETEREFINVSVEMARLEAIRRQRLMWLGTVGLLVLFTILTAWALFNVNKATIARNEAEAAVTRAVANAETAQAERNNAVTARAALEANLEANLTAQAISAVTVTQPPTSLPTTPIPANSLTPSPVASPTSTPNLAATATVEVMQAQLDEVRATQTAVVVPPFTDGIVVSYGGASGDYLLRDPQNENSGIAWIPVGRKVTLLRQGQGSPSYGSGTWYLVLVADPDTRKMLEGWLPAEVIQARQ